MNPEPDAVTHEIPTAASTDTLPFSERAAHRLVGLDDDYRCRCGSVFTADANGWAGWLNHLPPPPKRTWTSDGFARERPDLERLPLARFDKALMVLRETHVPDLVDSLGCALSMFRVAGFEVPELEPQPTQPDTDVPEEST